MKKSTKVVPIDLLAQSNKRSKSPSPTKHKHNSYLGEHSHQFSFSDQRSPFLSNSSKKQQKSPLSKNLFGKSPTRLNKTTTSPIKNKVIGKSNKKIQSPSRYSKKINEDQLFKKNMKNLKKTFFNEVRNNRQQTIRTLKQIGKYAAGRKSRQRQYRLNESLSKKKVKNIPVQFYGFDPQEQQEYSPYHSNRQKEVSSLKQKQYESWSKLSKDAGVQVSIDKGTYYNFQDEFKQQLQKNQLQYIRMNIDNPKISYSPILPPHENDKNYEVTAYVPEIESINEVQIDGICEIFEMCEKYNEGDRLILSEFHQLLQQFQRLYFIKIIQQSQAQGVNKQKILIAQQNYYDILKRFQQNFKIVFYRREACDIYDCLYYLKQCSRLDKVCSLFLGIKKILNI